MASGCLGFGIFVGPAPQLMHLHIRCSLIGIVALRRVIKKCTAAQLTYNQHKQIKSFDYKF